MLLWEIWYTWCISCDISDQGSSWKGLMCSRKKKARKGQTKLGCEQWREDSNSQKEEKRQKEGRQSPLFVDSVILEQHIDCLIGSWTSWAITIPIFWAVQASSMFSFKYKKKKHEHTLIRKHRERQHNKKVAFYVTHTVLSAPLSPITYTHKRGNLSSYTAWFNSMCSPFFK